LFRNAHLKLTSELQLTDGLLTYQLTKRFRNRPWVSIVLGLLCGTCCFFFFVTLCSDGHCYAPVYAISF